MAIDTYAALKTAVADYLQRADLTSIIPTFVELATARFSDELRTPEMETVATTTIVAEWTALPIDFRAAKLFETDGKVLEYQTPWQLQKLIQGNVTPSAPVFTIQDMQFRIYPFQSNAVVELTYYAALPALVNNTDTNWLLRKRPDVYLNACLAQARLFLHDDERLAASSQFTDKYIAEANRAARYIAIGSTPLAVKAA